MSHAYGLVKRTLSQSLRMTLLSGACGLAATAVAQDVAPSDALEEVVVTGSRLAQPGLVSNSPLSVITDADIKASGNVAIEAVLNSMPQVFAAQSQQLNNTGGVATANLRGLGPTRTLVLVDGRRLMPGDPSAAAFAADLNNIPTELVERVEVVTGGASAVYGSDAVAGVVNFIMKRNFEGIRLSGQTGFANHHQHNSDAQQAIRAYALLPSQQALTAQGVSGVPAVPKNVGADGWNENASVILGTNTGDGKGNITAYLTYRHLDPVVATSRDFSACTIGTTGPGNTQHVCTGGNLGPQGAFAFRSGPAVSATNLATNPDGSRTFVPYNAATMGFSIGQYNYMQRDDSLRTAGFFGHYELNKHADLYADLMFADNQTTGALAPQGLQQGNNPAVGYYTLNCDNPLISAAQRTQICGALTSVNAAISYRLTGARQSSFAYRHTDYKYAFGSRGELGDAWKYDAYIQYGSVNQTARNYPLVSVNKAQRALNVVVGPGGVPTCQSVINGTDRNCVPLDIFSFNGPSQTAVDYVTYSNNSSGYTRQTIISGAVTGELDRYGLKSPWAATGLAVALGAEQRRDAVGNYPDSAALLGEGGAIGTPPIPRAIEVKDYFGELRVPLIEDRAFAKYLAVETGYRLSNYDTQADKVEALKFAIDYAPISDVRLRGGYNRAIRAPNMFELYAAQSFGITTAIDPCAGATPSASLADCSRTGVTAAQYGFITQCPANSCRALTGGNTNLKPEVANTTTFGFVLQPRFLPGFSATVDYYDIKVKNVVLNPAGQSISNCLNTGLAYWCGLVNRDPTTGSLAAGNGYLTATNVNAGYYQTKGIDVQTNYVADLADWNLPAWGSVSLGLTGTYLKSFVLEPQPGLGNYDCAGLYGATCNTIVRAPLPAWRHTLRTTWKTPWDFNISTAWRHISGMSLDRNESNPLLAGSYDAIDARITSRDYLDLSGDVALLDRYTVRFGVRNVFDRDPPVLDSNNLNIASPAAYGSLNTYPGLFDVLGRVFFFGVTADF